MRNARKSRRLVRFVMVCLSVLEETQEHPGTITGDWVSCMFLICLQ